MDKIAIRKKFLAERKNLSAKEIKIRSQKIAGNFIENLLPKIDNFFAKKLAFYLAANNEVDPIYIINHLQKFDQQLALPRLIKPSEPLVFHQYKIGDPLQNNKIYPQISEPLSHQKLVTPEIILVPLVAFDQNCYRIGMGGGFYDRTIKQLRSNKAAKPLFIGLAYDSQNCQELIKIDKYDQRLDFIACESQILIS